MDSKRFEILQTVGEKTSILEDYHCSENAEDAYKSIKENKYHVRENDLDDSDKITFESGTSFSMNSTVTDGCGNFIRNEPVEHQPFSL